RNHAKTKHLARLHPKRKYQKRNRPKRNHPKRNHPKRNHPKMNHPKRNHPKRNHPKRKHLAWLHPKTRRLAWLHLNCNRDPASVLIEREGDFLPGKLLKRLKRRIFPGQKGTYMIGRGGLIRYPTAARLWLRRRP
ncbi:hypothetical protein KXV57_007925, partial [Aspergillus fumigatus]